MKKIVISAAAGVMIILALAGFYRVPEGEGRLLRPFRGGEPVASAGTGLRWAPPFLFTKETVPVFSRQNTFSLASRGHSAAIKVTWSPDPGRLHKVEPSYLERIITLEELDWMADAAAAGLPGEDVLALAGDPGWNDAANSAREAFESALRDASLEAEDFELFLDPDSSALRELTRGCIRDSDAPPVFLIGIDALTWRVLDPMIERGEAPNLASLVREGARADLKSYEPMFSPMLWASISTGKRAADHGVSGFTVKKANGERVPITSNFRRVRTIWDILGDAGMPVGVLGWWTTWPAEKVNGFLCSEFTWPLKKNALGFPLQSDAELEMAARTWPPRLFNDVRDLLVFSEDLPGQLREMLRIPIMLETGKSFSPADAAAKDLTYHNMAKRLLPRFAPGFFTIYYESIDVVCHEHWTKYEFLESKRRGEDPEYPRAKPEYYPVVEELGRSIEGFYSFVDSLLGDLLTIFPEDAAVIVVSDHGFAPRDPSKPTRIGDEIYSAVPHFHALDGVLIASGPMFRSGVVVDDASVLDIMPTVLEAAGLPAAADLAGRARHDLFVKDFRGSADHPRLLSYEYSDRARPSRAVDPSITAQGIEMLRSLGYLR